MGKIIELCHAAEAKSDETVRIPRRKTQMQKSYQAFIRLLGCVDNLYDGAADEPPRELIIACCELFTALLPLAPNDVIKDISYVVILYLKKQQLLLKPAASEGASSPGSHEPPTGTFNTEQKR